MAEDALPHKLTLDMRRNLTMTGVTEVVSFDDITVVLNTSLGTLTVQGQELRLNSLSTEGGQVTVSGTIDALTYQEPRSPAHRWRRLLG